jgi:hypothetical protein
LALTQRDKFTCFCIFSLQGPFECQTDRIFCNIIILGNQGPWEEEFNMAIMPQGKKRGAPFIQNSWLHGGSHLPLVGPIAANFGLMEPYWPKTNYKRDLPVGSRDGAVKKHKIHNSCEDRRGSAAGAAPGCPFVSVSFSTMLKREYFIPILWDCGSNLYHSLSCSSLIRVTSAAYHDCDNIRHSYDGSFVYEMIYEIQIYFWPSFMNICICYHVLLCLFWSN